MRVQVNPLINFVLLAVLGCVLYAVFESERGSSDSPYEHTSGPEKRKPKKHRVSTPYAIQKAFGCTTYPCIVRDSIGGFGDVFEAAADAINGTDNVVIIDGDCKSACVLFVDWARNNVCMTLNAVFKIHMGGPVTKDRYGNYVPDDRYPRNAPPHSRDFDTFFRGRGGYPLDGFNSFQPGQMQHFVRMCTNDDWSGR